MLVEKDPELSALRTRIAALKSRAVLHATTLQTLAAAFPESLLANLNAETAELVLAAADLNSQALDPDEVVRRLADCRRVTKEAIDTVDAERREIQAKYGDNPRHAETLLRECVAYEVVEMVRGAVDILLWSEAHQERAWREAVERLEQLSK